MIMMSAMSSKFVKNLRAFLREWCVCPQTFHGGTATVADAAGLHGTSGGGHTIPVGTEILDEL